MDSIKNFKNYAFLGAVLEDDFDAAKKLLSLGADPKHKYESCDHLKESIYYKSKYNDKFEQLFAQDEIAMDPDEVSG